MSTACLLAASRLLLGANPNAGPALQVEGQLVWTAVPVQESFRYNFRIGLAGDRWEIQALPVATPRADAARYTTYRAAGDAGVVYVIQGLQPGRGTGDRVHKAPPGADTIANTMIIRVHEQGVPNCNNITPVLWLALCSGPYLARTSSPAFMPAVFFLHVLSGGVMGPSEAPYFREFAWWTPLPGSAGLPAYFVMWDDGQVKVSQGMQILNTGRRYPEPFESGFTNIVYEVHETVRAGPRVIPSAGTLRVFALRRYSGETLDPVQDVMEVHRVEVRVTHVQPLASSIELPPSIQGVGVVQDHRARFSETRPTWVTYSVTNRIPSVEELSAARLGRHSALALAQDQWTALARAERLAPDPAQARSRARWFRTTLLLSTLGLILAWAWITYGRKLRSRTRFP